MQAASTTDKRNDRCRRSARTESVSDGRVACSAWSDGRELTLAHRLSLRRARRRTVVRAASLPARTALPPRAISSTQNSRPDSPPSRGTTVAGQRRDLTGLRWYCTTSVHDRGETDDR